MLSLEGLQNTVAQSVLGTPHFGLAALLERGRANPYRRLRVYRNNTRASLTATLMAVFPVTVRMVDERFFRYAASEFIRANPPREPRLVRYGANFPAFLRTFDGMGELPFVARRHGSNGRSPRRSTAPSQPAHRPDWPRRSGRAAQDTPAATVAAADHLALAGAVDLVGAPGRRRAFRLVAAQTGARRAVAQRATLPLLAADAGRSSRSAIHSPPASVWSKP